jgi:ammonium transporter, Amt family
MRTLLRTLAVLGIALLAAGPGLAQAVAPEALPADPALGPDAAAALQINLNYVWMVLAAILVLFMQAGFALVETGLTRAKNAANIMMKNFMDAAAGSLMFWVVGFGIMFGAPALGGLFGTTGFGLGGLTPPDGLGPEWIYAFFFFQAVFAATAATIVSGAVAERTKFSAYLVFSLVITALIYPVFGAWAWGGLLNGGGWLENLGFLDFAGSTVVHSVGGWAALAGALVIGPRLGKYAADGTPLPIRGHSLPLFGLGVFILWVGWFGFNAGSTTTGDASIALIAANTMLAASGGAVGAMVVTWLRSKRPDVTMTLNGVLGGLVGITAGCDAVLPGSAILIGLIAGTVLVYATSFIERFVDDAVGAVAVHGVCGVWGTLAVALFHVDGFSLTQLGVQALGAGVAFAWAFGVSYVIFRAIDALIGMRAEDDHQAVGLDHAEHGAQAYPEFTGVWGEAGDGARVGEVLV